MRFLILILMVVYTYSLNAQTIDSAAIRQVDSLIKVSQELTAIKDFEKALEVNAIGEKIALERLGKMSAAYGNCTFNKGKIYSSKGNFPGAETWYIESITIRENLFGKLHPEYATSLNNLANVYYQTSNYEKAEPLYLEVISIREKLFGKDHHLYATSLSNLATLYWKMGNYKKAEPLHFESMTIREKVLGKEHPLYATSLNNLANLYFQTGQYEKVEPLHLEALAIREKVLGKEHPDYSESLANLGQLYDKSNNFEKAEQFYLDAKAIKEKVFGNQHPIYANSLNNLGNLYWKMGNYEKAESFMLQSKNIREKVLGMEHPDYASSLNNLAVLYRNMGNYEKAEPLYLNAKAIRQKVLGNEHPAFGQSLTNLATLYTDMGNFEKAEPLYLQAKSIYEKVLGNMHPDYAQILNSLASLYNDIGNYDQAELLYIEVLTNREKALGKDHPDNAVTLNNLGVLYQQSGKYEKSEPYLLKSTAILEKGHGKEHPYYAFSLSSLANLYNVMGNYEKAEPLYLQAKAIQEKVQGKEHPDYSSSLKNMANLYEKQSRYLEAEPLLEKEFAHSQSQLLNASTFLSEQELANYTATFQKSGDYLLSYLDTRKVKNAQQGILPSLAYDHALFYKGFLLTAASRLKSPSLSSAATMEINLQLKGLRRILAAEYIKPIAERKSVAELEEKANTAEKELARSVTGYAEAKRQIKWQEVMSNLKNEEAAIEFISYKVNFPKKTDSLMYAALLLKPGTKQPQFISLFEEKSLDSLIYSNSKRKADYVNSLYTLADRGAVAMEAPKKSLYEILWKPLEKELAGVKSIYFSPGGLLHRINLDAIPVSETETLADKYNLIELNSTRQLVIPTSIKNVNNDANLFGGIQYEQDSTLQNNEPMLASRSRGELSFSSVDSTLRGGSWNYLAGTEREVTTIEKIMQTAGVAVSLKKGYAATEESFKRIGSDNAPSPRILHIATHGYFFPDPKSTVKKSGLGGEQESVFKISDHPMLRSGLIMAGGNAYWQGMQTLEGKEDGILTAYEISQMNLSNTELVVLSACETGLGDIQGNEGVYGLQRAFKIAGAKYLIMSLWQVPDKQTSLLMTTFYKKWLEDKMTIPDAFHAAQKELRDIGLDPHQWAGFVLVE